MFRKFTKKTPVANLILVKLQAFTEAANRGVLYEKVFLERSSQTSQGNECVRDSIFIKLQALGCKKEALAQVLSLNLAKFPRTPFLQNTSRRLLLLLAFQKQPREVFY